MSEREPAWLDVLRPGPDTKHELSEGWAEIENQGGISLTPDEFRELLDHLADSLRPTIDVLGKRIVVLRVALEACEENLRLVHEAAGRVPKGAPMPRYSTFAAWRMAVDALAEESPVASPEQQSVNPEAP